jgi:putative ABC transport system permease protein
MAMLFRRLHHLLNRARYERELAEEIETHRAMVEERHASADASRRVMGNITLAREDAQSVWTWGALERFAQDVHYGARLLVRNPAFTLVAMFSVVNGVLLRPLPYHDPDRLVMIWAADPRREIQEVGTSFPTFTDWRAETRRFADMAIWATAAARVHGGGERERVQSAFVGANLFEVLGVNPLVGRTFTPQEEESRERVIVLSHALWQRQFGSNPGVIGRIVDVDGETPDGAVEPIQRLRVVGVMPDGFFFPTRDVQFWRPATLLGVDGKPQLYKRLWTDRFSDRWRVVARLQPAATGRDAQAELAQVGRRLSEAFPVPAGRPEFPGFGAAVVGLSEQLTGRDLRLALWVLLGAVGFVLLIACANVANLLLVRGTAREREFAIRTALGAGRARLARQLLIESALLAAGAGLSGLAAAVAGVRLIASAALPVPRLNEISIDGPVLLFTSGVSILAAVLFGVAPIWRVWRAEHGETLKDAGAGASQSLRLHRARSVLIVGECAFAVILLAGAGLLTRSFLKLQAIDPGFDPSGVLLVRADLPIPISRDWRQQEWATFRDIHDRIARLPGVKHSGSIVNFSIASNPRTPVTVEGQIARDSESDDLGVNGEEVTPGFFQAVGVPLRRGRFFDYAEQNAPVAVINEAFARRFFGGQDPIGRRFSQGRPGTKMYWYTVVGVVGDMRRQSLERQPLPEFFIPSTEPAMDLAVRVVGDPAAIAPAIRHEIRAAFPGAIIVRMTTMDAFLEQWTIQRRYETWLLGWFAAVALVLAGIGIYGVIQFAVSERTREIGIRIALGARAGEVTRMVLRQGMTLPSVGVILGVAGAFGLTRVIEHMLFEVSVTDPATLGIVVSALLAVALAACYLPARRAARVDPVVALRTE